MALLHALEEPDNNIKLINLLQCTSDSPQFHAKYEIRISEMHKNEPCLGLCLGSFDPSSSTKPWIPLTSMYKRLYVPVDTCKDDHDSIAKIARESHNLDSR